MNRIIGKLLGVALGLGIVMLVSMLIISCDTAHAATKWSGWQDAKQATFYTDMGGTASGRIIKPKSKYVAVDMSRVVSKKRWKKGSAKFRRSHFWYGEKLQLRRINGKYKGKVRTVTVADCGSFCGAGQMLGRGKNARWIDRWFDLTNGARLGFITWDEGVGAVTWRYEKVK